MNVVKQGWIMIEKLGDESGPGGNGCAPVIPILEAEEEWLVLAYTF